MEYRNDPRVGESKPIWMGLNKNEIERKKLYEFIREAYSIKSLIIHGEETKKISMLNDEYFLKIRNILRESIKYFIKNSGSWSSKVLENKILGGAFIEGGN